MGVKVSSVTIKDGHRLSYYHIGNITSEPCVVFLHGIMGNKKNLMTLARKLTEQHSALSALIFDLRNHGESTKHWMPFTVEASALDIVAACQKLTVRPRAIIGHSFGGKVAIIAGENIEGVEQVWLLDCPPGPVLERKPLRANAPPSALLLLDILASLTWPVASRKALTDQLESHGVPNMISAWMTTNLVEDAGGFTLLFSPAEVRQMLIDFIDIDLWPTVIALSQNTEIHLVAAEYGQRVVKSDREFLLSSARPGHGFFHLLRKSGHFVHVDNLKGLMEIFNEYLRLSE